MKKLPRAPKTFDEFSDTFPKIREAWDLLGDAGRTGPIDDRTCRIVKLAVAIGALKEGPTHSAVRKAMAADVTREEMEQVVALASSVIGLPSSVAVWSWIRDEAGSGKKPAVRSRKR